jgi:hypothetical protein
MLFQVAVRVHYAAEPVNDLEIIPMRAAIWYHAGC